MCVLLHIWAWIKKYWKYILFPVGILLAILGLVKRKEIGAVVAPKEVETEGERAAANDEARRKADEAAVAKRQAVEKLERDHATTIGRLTDLQKSKVEELREDPDKLNEFLLAVGKSIRR